MKINIVGHLPDTCRRSRHELGLLQVNFSVISAKDASDVPGEFRYRSECHPFTCLNNV
jgi:hypothetical protein